MYPAWHAALDRLMLELGVRLQSCSAWVAMYMGDEPFDARAALVNAYHQALDHAEALHAQLPGVMDKQPDPIGHLSEAVEELCNLWPDIDLLEAQVLEAVKAAVEKVSSLLLACMASV